MKYSRRVFKIFLGTGSD